MTLVQAYITAGATVIPCLPPGPQEREHARRLGIDENDLFGVDVPCGMTRWTRGSFLIASTQVSALYAAATVRLDLNDGSGGSLAIRNLYARPPQPFLWRQPGGLVLVELVDERWWWQFSSAALMDQVLAPLWSSDGRWQVNGTGAAVDITTYTDVLAEVATVAGGMSLTAPTGFVTRSPEHIRRLSDLIGSPNASLGMVVDAVGAANTQVVVPDGLGGFVFVDRAGLQAGYDKTMGIYARAFSGGGQPVNGAAGGTDPLVNIWNQAGIGNRAPREAMTILPQRSVEGKTVYDNVTDANVPADRVHFPYDQSFNEVAIPSWTRQPVRLGNGMLTESAVVVNDATGGTLTTCPGWNPTTLVGQARTDYAKRYEHVPFGRTCWAGFIPWYVSASDTIGQLGCVSYRLSEVDGVVSPFTVSVAREDDWRFGLQGVGENEPSRLVTGKGLAHAYRNCVGLTVVDVPPPMTRVFPARITASDGLGNWRWAYSFTEVEPNPAGGSTLSVSTGSYARTGLAYNMAENGNNLAGGLIAPGVDQANYPNATVAALPISTNTIVMMCEQFPTAHVNEGCTATGPRFWFSMPNAVLVECIEEG
jgi:hypothetical protein